MQPMVIAILALFSNTGAALRAGMPVNASAPPADLPVAQVHVASNASVNNASANASVLNVSAAKIPFNPHLDPAVGKVTTMYFNTYNGQQAQTIATGEWKPAAPEGDVWDGATMLPKPSCPLQLTSQTGYPTENRKKNLRLASIAVCQYLLSHTMDSLPKCGATQGEVCELMINIPAPNSDEHQEPHIGAAIALAAYSKICELGVATDYQCQVHRSGSAVLGGLKLTGVNPNRVQFKGFDVAGILDTELYDAYTLHFDYVYLAVDKKDEYEKTEFYQRQHDVLHWQHSPPQVAFCADLACLVTDFINSNR